MPFRFKLPRLPGLPRTATAPFCPSEVAGAVAVPPHASVWQKLRLYLSPGLLVSIGYMDPGNWATSILSLQLPFAMFRLFRLFRLIRLFRLTSRSDLMGELVNRWWVTASAWLLFGIISAANLWLVWQVFAD